MFTMKHKLRLLGLAAFGLSICQVGCGTSSTETLAIVGGEENGAQVDVVDVDFAPPEIESIPSEHEIGPHGGHIVRMQPGNQAVEWVQLDEEETVQIYLPDVAEVEQVKMNIALPDGKTQAFDLTADESLGEGAYQIQSPVLMTAMKMKEGIEVNLLVKAGGAQMSVPIEHIGCSCGNH